MTDRDPRSFRTEARARAALRVRLSGKDGSAGEGAWAVTRDVSKGGAFLRCDKPLNPGTRLRLTIVGTSEQDTLEVEAEVKWSAREPASERGVGVAFLNPPPAVRRRLEVLESQGELAVLELYDDANPSL